MTPELRRAVPSDVDAICLVIAAATPTVAPGDYIPNTAEFVRDHIATDAGFGLVATVDGRVVGFLLARFPGMDDDNLGRDLGVPEDELGTVAHMQTQAVVPEWQGHGLQRAFITAAEPLCAARGATIAACTVSPTNVHSLDSFLALGYRVAMETVKYGGHPRLVLSKKLEVLPSAG